MSKEKDVPAALFRALQAARALWGLIAGVSGPVVTGPDPQAWDRMGQNLRACFNWDNQDIQESSTVDEWDGFL
jgi:hypothetical protein